MKQILYDMGIFLCQWVNKNGWVKGGGVGGGGFIIEKIFYCFISCFGPFAAFFVAKCKFILEYIKVQCSCMICDKIFVTIYNSQPHLFKCTLCNKSFVSKYKPQVHIGIHKSSV